MSQIKWSVVEFEPKKVSRLRRIIRDLGFCNHKFIFAYSTKPPIKLERVTGQPLLFPKNTTRHYECEKCGQMSVENYNSYLYPY